jgi:tRNA C32,U32 (ribose-2'-O)-methylase TrmJ
MAAHAHDVLARRRTVATLGSAAGRGSRGRGERPRGRGATARRRRGTPPSILEAARKGRSRWSSARDHGLANSDLDLCQRIVQIPTGAGYPSLNLAQAVLIVAYELLLASATGHRGPDRARLVAPSTARRAAPSVRR